MTKPILKNKGTILIKKTLTVILVGAFLFTNTLGWAKEERPFSTAIEYKLFSSSPADNTKLAPPSKLNSEDFKYSLTVGAICKHVEHDGNLDDKSYLNDVLARLDAEKNHNIAVLPYEIIIEIPNEGLAIRYFDPTKANVITPYSDILRLQTKVIGSRLHRQTIHKIKTLPYITDASIVTIKLIGFGSPEHYNAWNNLSLETLAGDLRGAFGRKVDVGMEFVQEVEKADELEEKIMSASQPAILGISVQPGSLEVVKKFVEKIRSNKKFDMKKTLIVFGNQIPTYFPDAILEICPEGIIVRGEGEFALRGLVRYVKGEISLLDIPNLIYKSEDGSMVQTSLKTPDLESLEYISSADSYETIIHAGGNVQVVTSRGCPWGGCAFCTRSSFRRGGEVVPKGEPTRSWQGFTVDRVLRNIENIISKGISEVEFSDDEFIGGRSNECIDRIRAIADGIERLSKKYNIKFTFRIFTRPNIIYRDKDADNKNEIMKHLLMRLKEVGLVRVFIGVESGNATQLKRYNRGIRLEENIESLKILRSLGIDIDVGFIMFDPEMSLEEILGNVKFFRENGLMHYNQWPFRPLAVNAGSRIVADLNAKELLGEPNPNFMSYRSMYKNKEVGEIASVIESVSVRTRPIFYALKIKSKKYFDPSKKDSETMLAQNYVEANGFIYLYLMEELAKNITNSSREKIEGIIKVADQKAEDLARQVAADIADSRIHDEDGYITRQLTKIGITVVAKTKSQNAQGLTQETRQGLLTENQKYISKNKASFQDILGENKPDILLRVPVEAVEFTGIDNIKDFLATFQEAPNGYVELYYMSGTGEVPESVYQKYGLQKKALPKDFRRARESTVTLFPALKGEDINQSTIVSRLGSVNMAPENTILSPIGLQHDPTGLIRATILGLKIMDIARQIKEGKEIDKDAMHVDILNQLRDVLDPSDFKNFDLTPDDIIALAIGNINNILTALKKLIRLLPITPINAEELRQIYEHAKAVITAA